MLLSISLLCLSSHPHSLPLLSVNLTSVCFTSTPSSHLPPGRSRWTYTTGTEMGGKSSRLLSLLFFLFFFFFFSFVHFQLQIEFIKCHTLFCLGAVLSVKLLGIRTDGGLYLPGTSWMINQKQLAGERLQLSEHEVRVYER